MYTLYKLTFGEEEFIYFGITNISLKLKIDFIKKDFRFAKYVHLSINLKPLKENLDPDEALYEEFKIIFENLDTPNLLNSQKCSDRGRCLLYYLNKVAPKEHSSLLKYLLKPYIFSK